jgi:hypothetical protein
MPLRLTFATILLFLLASSFANDSAYLSKNVKKANIVIITKEGTSINGRVLDINIDYILLDAYPFNSPVKLSAFYIRPKDGYYKIEVEYIQAAVVNTKKKVGEHALAGGIGGVNMAGNSLENANATLAEGAGVTAAGLVVGGLVGTAKGIGKRKKATIPIYGRPDNLISLLNYYE